MPLPKVHAHEVGDPVDASMNSTVSGKHPLVTLAVKSATCAITGCANAIVKLKKAINNVRPENTG